MTNEYKLVSKRTDIGNVRENRISQIYSNLQKGDMDLPAEHLGKLEGVANGIENFMINNEEIKSITSEVRLKSLEENQK